MKKIAPIPVTTALCLFTACPHAQAQSYRSGLEGRLLRNRVTLPAPEQIVLFATREGEHPKPKWSGTFGSAYKSTDDGPHVFTAPFTIAIESQSGLWGVSIESDGYSKMEGESGGLTDPTVIGTRIFPITDKSVLIVGAGITIPVGGARGGDDASERLLGILFMEPD